MEKACPYDQLPEGFRDRTANKGFAVELRMDYVAAKGEVVKSEEIAGANATVSGTEVTALLPVLLESRRHSRRSDSFDKIDEA